MFWEIEFVEAVKEEIEDEQEKIRGSKSTNLVLIKLNSPHLKSKLLEFERLKKRKMLPS